MVARLSPGAQARFDLTTAVILAGFAFEAYNEPSPKDARWERGADGCDVAFLSQDFEKECYAGRLEVRLLEAKDLPVRKELAQAILSGGAPDPYVMLALNEGEAPAEKGAIALTRAVDIARSSTCWSRDENGKRARASGEKGRALWGEEERFSLYVRDPAKAQLTMTVFDEEVMAEDILIGAASVELAALLSNFDGTEEERSWSGWIPLKWRPPETQDNTVLAGAAAGAMLGGPPGALVGGFLGSMIKKGVQGSLRVELTYTPLALAAKPPPLVKKKDIRKVLEKYQAILPKEAAPEVGALASSIPRGATLGIDWSELSRRVGREGYVEGDDYELCCFIKHNATSTEVGIWRDTTNRKVVIAFRGTSDPRDMITDVNLLQTPWEGREDGKRESKEKEDPRQVHAGFFESAKSVNRRLKQLLVAACSNNPGEWEVLITGHSLGGALATLTAPEIASGVDTSRGFKTRPDESWVGKLSQLASDLVVDASKRSFGPNKPLSLKNVRLYTFGAPRVGNSEFARYFDAFGMEAFRVVNGADIVPRLPRHGTAAGAVLDYEHVGRTVLIDENGTIPDGIWIEGESPEGTCPLRGVNPLSNPFGEGKVLAEMTSSASEAALSAWNEYLTASKSGDVGKAIIAAAAQLTKARETIGSRLDTLSVSDAVSMLGLDPRFVESEMALIDSIRMGTGVMHHLEPSYFAGLKNALDAVQGVKRELPPVLDDGIFVPEGDAEADRVDFV